MCLFCPIMLASSCTQPREEEIYRWVRVNNVTVSLEPSSNYGSRSLPSRLTLKPLQKYEVRSSNCGPQDVPLDGTVTSLETLNDFADGGRGCLLPCPLITIVFDPRLLCLTRLIGSLLMGSFSPYAQITLIEPSLIARSCVLLQVYR